MALDLEGVAHGGMDREEFLRRTGALEALHLALPPSRRLMQILDAIVFPSLALMAALDPQIADRCDVSPQVVRDRSLAVPIHDDVRFGAWAALGDFGRTGSFGYFTV